jgi:hypothetical protein
MVCVNKVPCLLLRGHQECADRGDTVHSRTQQHTHTQQQPEKKRKIIIIKENGGWVSAAKAFHVKMSIDRKKNEIKIFFRV